jgi:hypothetical protein
MQDPSYVIEWMHAPDQQTGAAVEKRRVPLSVAEATSIRGPGDTPWSVTFPPDTHLGSWKPLLVWAITTTSQLHVAPAAPAQAAS